MVVEGIKSCWYQKQLRIELKSQQSRKAVPALLGLISMAQPEKEISEYLSSSTPSLVELQTSSTPTLPRGVSGSQERLSCQMHAKQQIS